MKSTLFDDEAAAREMQEGWGGRNSPSLSFLVEETDSLRDDDASASTLGPYHAFVRLDPEELCLVPLSGKRSGMLCRHAAGCNSSGHRNKRQESPPAAGFYNVLKASGADGALMEIKQDGFLTDAAYQAKRKAELEADERAMEQLGREGTPQARRPAAAGAQTERRGNLGGVPPRSISFQSTEKTEKKVEADELTVEDDDSVAEVKRGLAEAAQKLEQKEETLRDIARRLLADKEAFDAERAASAAATPDPAVRLKASASTRAYAVARGRKVGVYDSWEACQKQVDGYSNATFKMFKGHDALKKAQSYIMSATVPTPVPDDDDGLLWEPPAFKMPAGAAPPRSSAPSTAPRDDDGTPAPSRSSTQKETETIKQIQDRAKVGGDTSTGNKGKAFGFDVRDSVYLQKVLSPYDLPTDLANQVLAGMVDVLAMPYQSAAEEPIQQMAAAIEMITNDRQGTSQIAPSLKTISAKSKTALAKVKSQSSLQEISTLLNDPDLDAMASVLINMTAPFLLASPDDEELAKTKAMQCLPYRVMDGTLDAYRDLVRHLGTVYANTGVWSKVQDEIDYHVSKINAIRSSYSGRFQIAIRLYVYMREGRHKSWRSDRLFEKRIERLEAQTGPAETTETKGKGKFVPICKHCGGAHLGSDGNFTKCPFHDLSATEARTKWKERCLLLNQPAS